MGLLRKTWRKKKDQTGRPKKPYDDREKMGLQKGGEGSKADLVDVERREPS